MFVCDVDCLPDRAIDRSTARSLARSLARTSHSLSFFGVQGLKAGGLDFVTEGLPPSGGGVLRMGSAGETGQLASFGLGRHELSLSLSLLSSLLPLHTYIHTYICARLHTYTHMYI